MNTIQNIKEFSKPGIAPATVSGLDTGDGEVWELTVLLNQHLSHAIELRARAKQAYWNAKDGNYYALHKMFDDFSDELDSIADELAGRIMALGGIPAWVSSNAGKTSELPAYPAGSIEAPQHFEALIASYQAAGSKLPASIAKAAGKFDSATAAILTGFVKLIDAQMAVLAAHLPPRWTAKPAGKTAS